MSNPLAKSTTAGKTNQTSGSLVRCEVDVEVGKWVTPESCAVFRIDENAKLPEICFEISTTISGPYFWSWELQWNALACPQRRDRARFKQKHIRNYSEKGKFESPAKKWTANFNDSVLGGSLTVKVKAGDITFVRKVLILGSEPGSEKILSELNNYKGSHSREAELAKKIFKQESKFMHFFSDGEPLVSFDNGYGLGQATNPIPSYEQVWNWKKHVFYIVTVVIKAKRALAKKYLDAHGDYTDDDLDMETLVFYNGANYHYLIWDHASKKWHENFDVLCDPEQSNKGWDVSQESNRKMTIDELRKGLGGKPKYTGRCYAEHIKKIQ
jgi:hypothetical protein